MLVFNAKLFKVGLVAFAVILTATTGHADDWTNLSNPKHTESRYQIGVGIEYRADSRNEIDARPQFTLQFMKYTSSQKAWFISFGYTSKTSFAFNSQAETFSLGAGIRMQQQMRLLSPFFDLGLKHEYYTGKLDGRSLYHNKLGLSAGLGVSLRVTGNSRIDFGVQHLINSRESRPDYPSGVPGPPEWQGNSEFRGLGGPDLFPLYNPTHLYLSYRFGF